MILADFRNIFLGTPIYTPYQLIQSVNGWKRSREIGMCYAQWTDEEIGNFDKETGLIGIKCGIECYVQKDLSEIINNL